MSFVVLDSWTKRLKGLLGTNEHAVPVALLPCSSVHTWFMGYAIDVALVEASGRVLASYRNVPPWRFVRARGASEVLERPAQSSYWPKENELLVMRLFEGE